VGVDAGAALGPSPLGDPSFVGPISLSNGFPIWYQDQNGLKLQLCTDNLATVLAQDVTLGTEVVPAGRTVFPCLTAEPIANRPMSFPSNFGAEAFWWGADAIAGDPLLGTFQSANCGAFGPTTGPCLASALLTMGLQAGFLNATALAGNQVAFARIRIRIDAPVPGLYTVLHPFGQATYTVSSVQGRRAINETQDIGFPVPPVPPANFAAALADGPGPIEAVLPGAPPPVTAGVTVTCPVVPQDPPGSPRRPCVDDGIRFPPEYSSIGPFLTRPAAVGEPTIPGTAVPVTILNGNAYLSIPNQVIPGRLPTPIAPIDVPILPIAAGRPNFFQIVFTPIAGTPGLPAVCPAPGAFCLNAADSSNTIQVNNFTVVGKVFNEGPNTAPVANPDVAATLAGVQVLIPVLDNDVDVQAINPADPLNQADALNANVHGKDIGALQIQRPPNHGTAIRRVNFLDAKASALYSPAAGFTGYDSFTYVTQDTGGLLSNPATAVVMVDDLKITKTVFRPKVMKWQVAGTSTITEVPGTAGPGAAQRRASLGGSQVVAPAVAAPGTGSATFGVSAAQDRIDAALALVGVPATEARIHVGLPGENGPAIFTLFPVPGGQVSGTISVTLTAADLTGAPGTATFADAVHAILTGNAYVNVTTAGGGGEIRGLIGVPNTVAVHAGPNETGRQIGVAEVQPDGTWRLQHDALTPPSNTVSLVCGSGVKLLNHPAVTQ
jgi:hypothetical protein